MKKIFMLAISVALFTSCGQEQQTATIYPTMDTELQSTSPAMSSFKMTQAAPNLTHIDLDKEGSTHGDLLAFDADVQTEDGLKGKLSGYLLTIFIPEANEEAFQEKMVQMVIDLGEGNTIVVGGKSVYPHVDKSEMMINQTQLRAIIGGTGKFIGARGQIASNRNEDGSYEHVVELLQ